MKLNNIAYIVLLISCSYTSLAVAKPNAIIDFPLSIPVDGKNNYHTVITDPKMFGVCIGAKEEQVNRGEFSGNSFAYYSSAFMEISNHVSKIVNSCNKGDSKCYYNNISSSDAFIMQGYSKFYQMLTSQKISPSDLGKIVLLYCGKHIKIHGINS